MKKKNLYNKDMFYSIESTLRTADKERLAVKDEKTFIREGLTLLFRNGSDTRQKLIKELSIILFKPVYYNKGFEDPKFFFNKYKENRTYRPLMKETKEAYENAVRQLNKNLALITNYWFLDFCSLDRNAKGENFRPFYYSSDFYAEKILDLYLKENGITKGE